MEIPAQGSWDVVKLVGTFQHSSSLNSE